VSAVRDAWTEVGVIGDERIEKPAA
jgi:hypothetical protein